MKQALRREQLKANSVRLHTAEDVVNFLQADMNRPHLAYPAARRQIDRNFHLVGAKEVPRDKPLACQTVSGTRSMHSIRSVNHTNNVLLEVRDFSCFCSACVRHGTGVCIAALHAEPWRLVTLQPIVSGDAMQEVEDSELDWSVEPDENVLAAGCAVGDHFAIIADTENPDDGGAEFYILICTKPMYIFQGDSIRDAWNTLVDHGDEVLEGLYYRQQGRNDNSYVLLRDQGVAYVFSHHVVATKFSMRMAPYKQKGGVSVFHLSPNALRHISIRIQDRREREELDLHEEGDLHSDDSDSSDSCNSSSEESGSDED